MKDQEWRSSSCHIVDERAGENTSAAWRENGLLVWVGDEMFPRVLMRVMSNGPVASENHGYTTARKRERKKGKGPGPRAAPDGARSFRRDSTQQRASQLQTPPTNARMFSAELWLTGASQSTFPRTGSFGSRAVRATAQAWAQRWVPDPSIRSIGELAEGGDVTKKIEGVVLSVALG